MNQKPAYMLNLEVPVNLCDINLSPNKREVIISVESLVIDALRNELDQLYAPSRSTFASSQGGLASSQEIFSYSQRTLCQTGKTIPEKEVIQIDDDADTTQDHDTGEGPDGQLHKSESFLMDFEERIIPQLEDERDDKAPAESSSSLSVSRSPKVQWTSPEDDFMSSRSTPPSRGLGKRLNPPPSQRSPSVLSTSTPLSLTPSERKRKRWSPGGRFHSPTTKDTDCTGTTDENHPNRMNKGTETGGTDIAKSSPGEISISDDVIDMGQARTMKWSFNASENLRRFQRDTQRVHSNDNRPSVRTHFMDALHLDSEAATVGFPPLNDKSFETETQQDEKLDKKSEEMSEEMSQSIYKLHKKVSSNV